MLVPSGGGGSVGHEASVLSRESMDCGDGEQHARVCVRDDRDDDDDDDEDEDAGCDRDADETDAWADTS